MAWAYYTGNYDDNQDPDWVKIVGGKAGEKSLK